MDATTYIMRLIETHENRIRPEGRNALTDEQREFYQVTESVARNSRDNNVFSIDIASAYKRKFKTDLNMLPTDFCYNLVNRGPDFEVKFLLMLERGKFRFVDFGWAADDRQIDIKWTPRGKHMPEVLRGRTFSVGIYYHGVYSWNFHQDLAPFL